MAFNEPQFLAVGVETETLVGKPTPDIAAPPAAEPEETPEDIKRRARRPPADGPCKGCGKNKPLNRLFLCYDCWLLKRLKEQGWREGLPHPPGCGCDRECRFESKSAGN